MPLFRKMICILAALLVVLCAVLCYRGTHVTFEGNRLALQSVQPNAVVMVDQDGNEAILRGTGDISYFEGMAEVTYRGRAFGRAHNWERDETQVYTFSNGTSVVEPLLQVVFDGDETSPTLTPLQRSEYDLINKMIAYQQEGNPIGRIIGYGMLSLLILALGTASFCFPHAFWKLDIMFTVRGGEPTEYAIISRKVAGLLLIAAAFALPVVAML